MAWVGSAQLAILRTVSGGKWFDAVKQGTMQRAAFRLHDRRLLARDPQNAYRWTSTEQGEKAIREHDADQT